MLKQREERRAEAQKQMEARRAEAQKQMEAQHEAMHQAMQERRRFSDTLKSRRNDGRFRPSGVTLKPMKGDPAVMRGVETDEVQTSEG